jgi:hypothetical protein
MLSSSERWCPDSEVRCTCISRFTNFRLDQDTRKVLASCVVKVSKSVPEMVNSMATPEPPH